MVVVENNDGVSSGGGENLCGLCDGAGRKLKKTMNDSYLHEKVKKQRISQERQGGN